MRKILIISFAFVIVLCSFNIARAFEPNSLSAKYFMNVQGKDSLNNHVLSNYSFNNSVFFKIYSSLTPFGTSRWQRFNLSNTKIVSDKILELPFVAVPFFTNQRNRLPGFSGKCIHVFNLFNILSILLFTGFVLSFKSNPQSKNEPRFRVPILIE
ncbi:MAG: hypothetical protein ACOC5R_01970 [Elusimicrobiota bacterium]